MGNAFDDEKPSESHRQANRVTGATAAYEAAKWKNSHPRAYWLMADTALRIAGSGRRLSISMVAEVVRATYIPREENEVPFKVNNTLLPALARMLEADYPEELGGRFEKRRSLSDDMVGKVNADG